MSERWEDGKGGMRSGKVGREYGSVGAEIAPAFVLLRLFMRVYERAYKKFD